MNEADVQYLRTLPYTITLPAHNAIIVHAGFVPGVELSEQQPLDMVSMRNVRKGEGEQGYTAFEKNEPGGSAWATVWQGPEHVYFGHDAKRGLQQCEFATGLDTGCLYGNTLTAAILEHGYAPRLVSVPARRQYQAPKFQKAASIEALPGMGKYLRSPAVVLLCCTIGAVGYLLHRRYSDRRDKTA